MAKIQTNKKSQHGVYGKLKDTVFITPFKKFLPLQQQTIDNNPATYYGSSSGPFMSNSAPKKTEKNGGTKPRESYNKKFMKMLTTRHNKSASKMFQNADNDQGHYNNNNNDNDQFSEYINRVKSGMRTDSNIGTETLPAKRVHRRDSLNDKVSNFLSKAKMKIRTTSSVGGMKRNYYE